MERKEKIHNNEMLLGVPMSDFTKMNNAEIKDRYKTLHQQRLELLESRAFNTLGIKLVQDHIRKLIVYEQILSEDEQISIQQCCMDKYMKTRNEYDELKKIDLFAHVR